MIGNCKTKLKRDNKYTVVNNVTHHMKSIHGVEVTGKTNWGGVRHSAIGRCPPTHAFFKARDMLIQTNVGCNFICKECYPTYSSLSIHNKEHNRQEIQKKDNLPVVDK